MATAEIRTPGFCTQCRSRCGCVAVVAGQRLLRIEPLPGHPSGEQLCPKGKAAPELVYHPDRLTRPLRRTAPKGAPDPGWQAISWEAALNEIAAKMGAIRDTHGAEQVAFSVTTPSGTHMSDGISWVERLVRAYGSPNSIYGTEICNWHKDFASRFTFGHDIGTPDFAHTDCVLLWGHNPANTWLARAGEIRKALQRGARMIVVDPQRTVFARSADSWLRVRPGTDQALALGLAHLLLSTDRFDAAFVTHWTNGPLLVRDDTGRLLRESDVREGGRPDVAMAASQEGGALLRYDLGSGRWLDGPARPALRTPDALRVADGRLSCRTAFSRYEAVAAQYPPRRVAELTGIAPTALAATADLLAGATSLAWYAWNGVGQGPLATQTDRAISLLYALTGHYGAQGGNVPGAAASFADISGLELLAPAQRAKALGLSTRPLGPGLNGWVTARDVYKAVLQRDPYPVRMLVSFGTNLLASQPDTDLARQALGALEFHVHADFSMNPTARYADIVLPVATSWERTGLRTGFDASLDGLRRVQWRSPVIPPIGESRSDIDIVLALAQRLGLAEHFFDGDAERGHEAVLQPAGLTLAALRAAPEGIDVAGQVPLRAYAVKRADGSPAGFPTPSRRIEIWSERLHEIGQAALPELCEQDLPQPLPGFPLRLSSAKTMVYCHSQHRHLPSLRRLMPDPLLTMGTAAALARGIGKDDWVIVQTPSGTLRARARLSDSVDPGSVFAQHGWWMPVGDDAPIDINLNTLMDTSRQDPVSGSIALRCSWCEVRRLSAPESRPGT